MKSEHEQEREHHRRALLLSGHVQQFVDQMIPIAGANDPTSLILKGHLLVERGMNELLAEVLGIEELPDKHRLTFAQRYDLVHEHVCSRNLGPNADLLESIKALNRLRNDTAHYLLEQTDLRQKIKSLVSHHYVRMGKKKSFSGQLSAHFLNVVRDLLVFLVDLRSAVIKNRAGCG